MKKIAVAILAFLYFGVSSGVAMQIHYCMGKKAGVELYGEVNDKCGKCGMKLLWERIFPFFIQVSPVPG